MITANNYENFEVAKVIASEYMKGIALSERKMAEKHNVKRSLIQRVKKEFAKGDWTEILTPKKEVKVVKMKYPVKREVKMSNVDLTDRTHRNTPAQRSIEVFREVNGDFEKFAKALLRANPKMTSAYINGQFHRCENLGKYVK